MSFEKIKNEALKATPEETAKTLGMVFGWIIAFILVGLLESTFVTWIVGFFVHYPLTFSNVLLTWGALIAIRLVVRNI